MDNKIRVAKTRFWKEYVKEINREDSTKIWKTIKMLNEEKTMTEKMNHWWLTGWSLRAMKRRQLASCACMPK